MVKAIKILILVCLVICGFLVGLLVGSDLASNTNNTDNTNLAEVIKPSETNINVASEVKQPENQSVSLTINFGNDKIASAKVAWFDNMTVWNVLNDGTGYLGLAVKSKEYSGMGVFVEAIGDQKNSSDKYWQYWLNGKYAKVGASSQKVNSGDVIEWKFIKGQM